MFRLIYFGLYLAFLLNVFYVMHFNLYLHYCSIFFILCFIKCLWRNRCRMCMCRTCGEPMRHPLGNDAYHMNVIDARFSN
jgi:hypothetical protein